MKEGGWVSLGRIIGRRMVVDLTLLKDLEVRLVESDSRGLLSVRGSIMESSKVFDTLGLAAKGRTIRLTVYASLAFWHRGGSPDFSVTEELRLPPGTYTVEYAGGEGEPVFLREIRSRAHEG